MIDEDRTRQLYGYTSDELSPCSRKPVVRVCEECGGYRVVPKLSQMHNHSGLCLACSNGTKEKRALMREVGLGRKHTREELSKMSSSQIGKKNHNWKGGITAWRSKMWFTSAYKNWRKEVFERDGYTCMMCGERGGELEAHHIHPVRDHKNDLLLYDVDNGVTLCKRCHMSINNGRDVEYISKFESMIRGD